MRRYQLDHAIKIMKSVYVLLALTILLSLAHAETIAIIANASNPAPAPAPAPTNTVPTNLTKISQSQLAPNQTGQLTEEELTPEDALGRLGNDGDLLQYLYFETPEGGETYQYEGVLQISHGENETSYKLISPNYTTNGDYTLQSFLDSLVSANYSIYAPDQASEDASLAQVQKAIKESHPEVAGTILTAIYAGKYEQANGYFIFYMGATADSVTMWRAIGFNDKTGTYIARFEKILVLTKMKK